MFFADAQEAGGVVDRRVIEAGGATCPHPPLCGHGLKEAECLPVVWPDLDGVVVVRRRQAEQAELLG